MQSGEVLTFSPSNISAAKTVVPRPTSVQSQSVIAVSWLSNPDFLCTYAPPGFLVPDTPQTHLLVSLDSKAGVVSEVTLASPFLPFPGLRPPGSFTMVLRQWEPAKFLLFVGDSTSSDIGLLGCTESNGQEAWVNYTLEETSTPAVPLDQEMNDTILLGLALDLTTMETYTHKTASGEDSVLPPPPTMYAYANDGTVIGWNVLNTLGKPYPGMRSVAAPVSIQQTTSINMETVDMDDKPTQETAPSVATPQAQPTPVFSQPSSGSAFGQSSFGQPSFGSAPTATSAFGVQPTGSGAFGAFASAGPSKFGQPSSLDPSSLAPPPASPAVASPMAVSMSNMSSAEETMSTDTPTDTGFGGLSLGGSSSVGESDKSKSSGVTGMFGAFNSTPTPASNATPGFGSASSFGSILKPATGFGAFGGQTTSGLGFGSSSTDSTNALPTSSTSSAPSPAFGASSFGTAKPASPAFGQSGFGSKSAFGQSSFGQPAFGQSTFSAPPTPKPAFGSTSSSLGGGFAAFAQGGATAFNSAAKASTDAKPANTTPKVDDGQKTQDEEKKADTQTSTPVFGTQVMQPSTPAATTTSAFGSSNAFSSTATLTTPTHTPVKSNPAAPSGGAFSGLAASPIGFGKLDSGFGAFGSTTPTNSPFFNPPKAPATSVFGNSTPVALAATPSAPATPTPSTKPTFGAPSVFGKPAISPKPTETKSAFGASSPAFGQSAFANLGNTSAKGFSNFAAGGGFGAFVGEKKSFGELLRGDTDAKGKESAAPKTPVSVFSKPPPPVKQENKGEGSSKVEQPRRTSVFAVPLDKKIDHKGTIFTRVNHTHSNMEYRLQRR